MREPAYYLTASLWLPNTGKTDYPVVFDSDDSAALSLDVSANDIYIAGYQTVPGGGTEAFIGKMEKHNRLQMVQRTE